MKAAILVESKQPLVIDDITMPELGYGQVKVNVNFSGICGSQLGEIDAVKGPDKYLPHLLGHEGSGHVEAVGPGVNRVKEGDHVVMHWRKASGCESFPPKYKWGNTDVNAGWVTTFNEKAIVVENRLTPIPHDLDGAIAALFGCAITTGVGIITRDAALRVGETVVVFGAGGVGLSVILGASLAGASRVIAVDLHDGRLALAKRYGATDTLVAGDKNTDAIRDLLAPLPCDVVVDTTGNINVIQNAYSLADRTGRIILAGVPRHDQNITIHSLPLHFGKTLKGSEGGGTQPERDIPRYVSLLNQGRIDLDDMITDRFALDDINEALAGMRDGSIAGRPIVTL